MKNPSQDLRSRLETIAAEHEKQFSLAVQAALHDNKIHRSFPRWLSYTWKYAEGRGANFNPFISAMFAYLTTALLKKFLETIPLESKTHALDTAIGLFRGYLDQVRDAAEMDINQTIAKEAGLNITEDSRVAQATKRDEGTKH